MGFLVEGTPLSWQETKKASFFVRVNGIRQFIRLYHQTKDRAGDVFKFGDEVEYMLVHVDEEKRARLSLRASELLNVMNDREERDGSSGAGLWRAESAEYMIEGVPDKPFVLSFDGNRLLSNFSSIEENMIQRRKDLEQLLHPNEHLLCLTAFPSLGAKDSTIPYSPPDPETGITGSIFLSDDTISRHIRYRTAMRHFRERQERKPVINAPIFRDRNTADPFVEVFDGEVNSESRLACKPNHVYMDSANFGYGCSCLQVTMQAPDVRQAMHLYDQLIPVTAIALALTAAAPVFRAHLTEWDSRWPLICQAADERTKEERGDQPVTHGMRIKTSRYGPVASYLSDSSQAFNDVGFEMIDEFYNMMSEAGVDDGIAKHMAHLFIRDPLILFDQQLKQADEEDAGLFLNIQSSVWQSLRFKPPDAPDPKSAGWRVEFRTMDLQVTEFQNSAFVVFIVLLSQIILHSDIEFRIPMSRVHENMEHVSKRAAVINSKFWFRTKDGTCQLMTVDEIVNGNNVFEGLIPLIREFLKTFSMDEKEELLVNRFLDLVSGRASGKNQTIASWIRGFADSHPDYQHDSVFTHDMTSDLMQEIINMTLRV